MAENGKKSSPNPNVFKGKEGLGKGQEVLTNFDNRKLIGDLVDAMRDPGYKNALEKDKKNPEKGYVNVEKFFYSYLEKKYGKDILDYIDPERLSRQTIELLKQEGVTLKQIRQDTEIATKNPDTMSEQQIMARATTKLHALSQMQLFQTHGVKFEEFAKKYDIDVDDKTGECFVTTKTKLKTMKALQVAWFAFLKEKGIDVEKMKDDFGDVYQEMHAILYPRDRHNTQRILLKATITKYRHILVKEAPASLVDAFDQEFGPFLGAGEKLLPTIQPTTLEMFFDRVDKLLADPRFGLTNEQKNALRKKLDGSLLTYNDIYEAGVALGTYSPLEKNVTHLRQCAETFVSLCKDLHTKKVIHQVVESKEYLEEVKGQVRALFNPPTSLTDFLSFGFSEWQKYRQIGDPNDKANKQDAYMKLQQDIKKLEEEKEKLSDKLKKVQDELTLAQAQNNVAEQQRLQKQLEDLQKQIDECTHQISVLEVQKDDPTLSSSLSVEQERDAYLDYLAKLPGKFGGRKYEPHIFPILKKLVNAKFDTRVLDEEIVVNGQKTTGQAVLMRACIQEQLAEIDRGGDLFESMGFDKDMYKQFLLDWFDPTKSVATIRRPDGGYLTIAFAKDEKDRLMKGFLGYGREKLPSLKDTLKSSQLPLTFTIDIDACSGKDDSGKEITPDEIEKFLRATMRFPDGNGPLRSIGQFGGKDIVVANGYELALTKNGKTVVGYPYRADVDGSLKSFFSPAKQQELLAAYGKPGQTFEDLEMTFTYIYNYPIDKPLPPGKKREVVDIIYGPNDLATYDDVQIRKRHINVSGDNIKRLATSSLIFATKSNVTDITHEDPIEKKKIENDIKRLNKDLKDKGYIDTKQNQLEQKDDKAKTQKEQTDESGRAGFDKKWQELAGYQFSEQEQFGLKEGTVLYVDTTFDSDLPPQGSTYMYARKVSAVTDTYIKMKVVGGHKDPKGIMGKEITIPRTADKMDILTKHFKAIYKFPPAEKKDFITYVKDVRANRKGDAMNFDMFNDLQLKGKSFTKEGKTVQFVVPAENAITYSLDTRTADEKKAEQASYGEFGQNKPGITDIRGYKWQTVYNVEYLGNGKFRLTCEYPVEEQEGEGGSKRVIRKKYKNGCELDYAGLMTFVAKRKLQARTEEEIKHINEINEQTANNVGLDDLPKPEKHFLSIKNIKNVIKGFIDKVKGKIDEKNKDDEYVLLDRLIGGEDSFLKNFFGRPLIGGALASIHYEHQNERDAKIRAKIQAYQDTVFSTKVHWSILIPNRIMPLMAKIADPKTGEIKRNVSLSTDERYQLCAILLRACEKGDGSIYPRALYPFAGKGVYVKGILSHRHWLHYCQIRDAFIAREKEKGEKDITTALNNLEIKYIVDNLRGGPHQLLDGDANKQLLPVLSRSFANDLDKAGDSLKNPEGIDAEFKGRLEYGSFDIAKDEFESALGNNRIPIALGNLKAMYKLMKTQEDMYELRKCFLILLLTKTIYWGTSKDYKDQHIEKIARSVGFPIAGLQEDPNQHYKTKKILDIATAGGFTSEILYNGKSYSEDDFGFVTRSTNLKAFMAGFSAWWSKNKTIVSDFLSCSDWLADDSLPALAYGIKAYKPPKTLSRTVEGRKYEVTPDDQKILYELFQNYNGSSTHAHYKEDEEMSSADIAYEDAFFTSHANAVGLFSEWGGSEARKSMILKFRGKISSYVRTSKGFAMVFDKEKDKGKFMALMQRICCLYEACIGAEQMKDIVATIGLIHKANPPLPKQEQESLVAAAIRKNWKNKYPPGFGDSLEVITKFITNNIHMFDEEVVEDMGGYYGDESFIRGFVNAYKDPIYKYIPKQQWSSMTPEQRRAKKMEYYDKNQPLRNTVLEDKNREMMGVRGYQERVGGESLDAILERMGYEKLFDYNDDGENFQPTGGETHLNINTQGLPNIIDAKSIKGEPGYQQNYARYNLDNDGIKVPLAQWLHKIEENFRDHWRQSAINLLKRTYIEKDNLFPSLQSVLSTLRDNGFTYEADWLQDEENQRMLQWD